MPVFKGRSIRSITRQLLCVLFLLLDVSAAQAENYQELLLFPAIEVDYAAYTDGEQADEKAHLKGVVDLFFALNYEKTLFLTEALASTHELELERAQLGWEYRPGHRFWLGRFHTPLGYWNPKYNHAAYLQTPIHRPLVARYEDDGGIIPMHVAGAQAEGEKNIAGGLLEYVFVYGAGAKFRDSQLAPTRLIEMREEGLGLNVFGKLSFRPDELNQTELGVFGGYSEMEATSLAISRIDQSVLGAYFHYSGINTRIISSLFYVNNRFNYSEDVSHNSLLAGYVHSEYEVGDSSTTFFRYEDSLGASLDPYVTLVSDFPRRKGTIGFRYDFLRAHALTLQLSSSQYSDQVQSDVSLLWSAIFP